MNLSKSRYVRGIQCPKMLWMEQHMPEQFDESVLNTVVLDTGSAVGDLAMGYYGDFVEVPFDASNLAGMAARTEELLAAGTPVICEATFAIDGCLCMVDILRVENDGVRIVEVKSSTHMDEIYYHDMAFQTWVLRSCGLNVKSVALMHLNNQYVRDGELDLQGLFMVEDSTETVMEMQDEIAGRIALLKETADQTEEPDIPIGCQCGVQYPCGYRGWCWRDVPSPSVFDLNGISMKKGLAWLDDGVATPADALTAGVKLNNRQRIQAEAEAADLDTVIDSEAIAQFLNELWFPLYFLDFETIQPAVPLFDGTRPYQQIPTQYSLHILREPGGELEHREFLAETGADPRRAVAERLAADIPAGVCTLAYNMGFEKGRIKELADTFSDLADRLLPINESMRDLIVPFKGGAYYARAMGGSNSIKAVLPALFPDDPELDYHALDGVHNGIEAMAAFADLANMDPQEAARTRESLLRYCELDTLAMVKIWQKLTAAVQENESPTV